MLANSNLLCIFYLFCPFVLLYPSGVKSLQIISVPLFIPRVWNSAGKEKVQTEKQITLSSEEFVFPEWKSHISKHIFLSLKNSCSLWKRTLEMTLFPLKLSSHQCRHTHTVSYSLQISGSVPCSSHHCVWVWAILRWHQTSCSQAYSDPPKHGMHDLGRQYFRSSSVLHLNQWAALACDSDHPSGQLHERALTSLIGF